MKLICKQCFLEGPYIIAIDMHGCMGYYHCVYELIAVYSFEGSATTSNHVDGSRNYEEVTNKIYVILELGIKLPLLFL